ncbi:MAG: HesA/MoeB/ThiF family protein [Rhodobacteraceae bacterium]|nr:HesA/MoeB/ThiF family protein [Paracoccaceae bacterium]
MTPEQVERYARHIVLREIGGPGQNKLLGAKVLCIGAGGLGSPALMYLAAAGVGTLGIVDDDVVSLSNLQRQVLHDTDKVGDLKTDSATAAINRINPEITVVSHTERLTESNAADIISRYDLVLDGSDNFETRYLVNATCVALKIPLISAAMSQWEGQISLYDPANGGPCYACVFPERPAAGLAPSCAEAGVMGALAGVMGSMMAGETIKHITGAGETLCGQLLIYDALYGEMRKIKTSANTSCKTCQQG